MGGSAHLWSQSQLLGISDSWLASPRLALANVLRAVCRNEMTQKKCHETYSWLGKERRHKIPAHSEALSTRQGSLPFPFFHFDAIWNEIHRLKTLRGIFCLFENPGWANILGTAAARKKKKEKKNKEDCEKKKLERKKLGLSSGEKNKHHKTVPSLPKAFLAFFWGRGKEHGSEKAKHSEGCEMRWCEHSPRAASSRVSTYLIALLLFRYEAEETICTNDCLEKGHGNLYMLIRLYLPIISYFQ